MPQAPQGSWVGALGDRGHFFPAWWEGTSGNTPANLLTGGSALISGASLPLIQKLNTLTPSGTVVLQNSYWSPPPYTLPLTWPAQALQDPAGVRRPSIGRWAAMGAGAKAAIDLTFRYPFTGNLSVYSADFSASDANYPTADAPAGFRQEVSVALQSGTGSASGNDELNFDFSGGWWSHFPISVEAGAVVRVQAVGILGSPGALINGITFEQRPVLSADPFEHDWRYIITDRSGNQYGEVTNADNRTLTLALSKASVATFSIPTSHALASLFDDPEKDLMLKVYRDGAQEFNGYIVSSDDQGAAQGSNTITVNAVSALWRYGYRQLGTPDINSGSIQAGWVSAVVSDLGLNVHSMIKAVNDVQFAGVDLGFWSPTHDGVAGPYWFKEADQAIDELAQGTNTFEWVEKPVETFVAGGQPHYATFDITDKYGSSPSNIIFEYGTGRANLVGYGHTIDRTKRATKAWIEQPGVSDHSGILSSTDGPTEATSGRYETLADSGDVQWDSLRQEIADLNVSTRKQARRMLTVTPRTNSAPVPNRDFFLGDMARARIVKDSGVLDATVRVWAMNFGVDKNGNENVELVLAPA